MAEVLVMKNTKITYLSNPSKEQLYDNAEQFLLSLTSTTVIDVSGKHPDICRVIVVLVHGNEPSGFIAMHRWLSLANKYQRQPLTNLRFIIASVEAAQCQPMFSTRFLAGGKDLNRCFGTDDNYGYFQRANLICAAIKEVSPEFVVDLHNTSGYGPAFAVTVKKGQAQSALASLFCQSMIFSGLRLGALMEQDFNCPIITIECGGSQDQQSHQVAFNGLEQLSRYSQLEHCHHLQLVEILDQPLRVQLDQDASLSYNNSKQDDISLTLIKDIEQLNFGVTSKGRGLGWLDKNSLEDIFIIDNLGNNLASDYFEVVEFELIAKTDVRLFMATKTKEIALSDCLFYIMHAS
jgi:hypothetical protein